MDDKIKYAAYHESGHCIIAMLFSDELDIRKVTINKEATKLMDASYNGGLDFGWKVHPSNTDFNAVDKIALIALAGICSTTIYVRGHKYINENLHKFPHDSSHLSSYGADVDYKIAKDHIVPLAECFSLEPISVQWNMLFFILRFLIKSEVWDCVTKMSERLITKDDNTLSFKEIIQLFDSIDYTNYIGVNKSALLSKRYPLNRHKLMFWGL
jgi:hypothetical protein